MAATLLIAVGTGAVASLAGISMTLGAFIAGLMLAETEYRRAIEAVIEPFKGLLLGTFFLVVGLKLDLDTLFAAPLYTLGVAAGIVLLKGAIVYGLARALQGQPRCGTRNAPCCSAPAANSASSSRRRHSPPASSRIPPAATSCWW